MQDFRNLDVWRRAHALVLAVYRATRDMPREEVFGLTIQLRKSATSMATRIAEGCGRGLDAEFAADLRRSSAAGSELEYSLLLATDLGYIQPEAAAPLALETVEVRKMLHGLLRRL